MSVPAAATTSTTSPAQGVNLIVTHAFHLALVEVAIIGLIAIAFTAVCAGIQRRVRRWRRH